MQQKSVGCLSSTGLVMSLVLVLTVMGIVLIWGGGLFSPGPLTAAHPRGAALGGYRSHAEFESHCSLCHRPFGGIDEARCTACHTDVSAQIAGASGVHGQVAQGGRCADCHTDHQGHDATIIAGGLEAFDHNAVFPLDGAHANLACDACHTDGRHQGTPRECAGCHQDPHGGANGSDCTRCHDATSWDVSRMDHTGLADCQSCHPPPDNHYAGQCSQCHLTTTSWVQVQFDHSGLADCQGCHASPANHYPGQCSQCHLDTTSWGSGAVHSRRADGLPELPHTAGQPLRWPVQPVPPGHHLMGLGAVQPCRPN